MLIEFADRLGVGVKSNLMMVWGKTKTDDTFFGLGNWKTEEKR